MSYQVLARKWRPKQFTEMVGQGHVLKALVNALDDNRLHHAYLFTGTRGVGKTSIARLFAKALNCEQGVSSKPCGHCSACCEIAEGRFVDLIEVDAASRTKVEDTRELLENVQYAPTRGRFKVYLIDEVHMLSKSSFNALLKTLEEPPPHVKFLLATTDPQKLPVTVLSRCLQFNLKNMIPQRIVEHLSSVLTAEQIAFEEAALWLLARSADGSMRDALSLTDQSIAFGAGAINEADVRVMLGTIDLGLVHELITALVAGDGLALMNSVASLAQFSPDYHNVLGDIVSLLHRIAIAQAVPAALDNSMGDKQQVTELAGQLSAEDVQLFYQIALMGRKDLPFVPDAREGLEMTLMRMLAFRPAQSQHLQAKTLLVDVNSATSDQQQSYQSSESSTNGVIGQGVEPVGLDAVSVPLEKKLESALLATAQDISSIAKSKMAGATMPVSDLSVDLQASDPRAELATQTQNNAADPHSMSTVQTQVSAVESVADSMNQHPSAVAMLTQEFSVEDSGSEVGHLAAVNQSLAAEENIEDVSIRAAAETKVNQPFVASSAIDTISEKKINPTAVGDLRESPGLAAKVLAEPKTLVGKADIDIAPWEDDYQAYQQSTAVENTAVGNTAVENTAAAVETALVSDESSNVVQSATSQINISQYLEPAVTEFSQLGLDDWPALVGAIGFTGMTAHIAENLSLESIADAQLDFNVSKVQKNVLDATQRDRIQTLLSQYFNREITVGYASLQSTRETPWQCFEQLRAKRLRLAISSFQADQVVQQLVSVFSAHIDRSSIMPVD
ncbi:MAG: DNA polymerase subunit gamma and tau [Osedax symbiont Rs2]|nr:MAG: DNA polymerase subunit gamma and tau [Osedax symbiont Rs2]